MYNEGYRPANNQVEFERLFKNQLAAWTAEVLKLECGNCQVLAEHVTFFLLKK